MIESLKAKLATDGAVHFRGALKSSLPQLRSAIIHLPEDQAGVRIQNSAAVRPLLGASGCIGRIAASILGRNAIAVRALLFDKSADTNWSLGWHQDRTICVKSRRETPNYGPWTVKSGVHHVAPPYALLAEMVTLRVHLDDVPEDNAPLLFAPGSHKIGKIAVDDVEKTARRLGVKTCLAEAGDVWVYSTPILHASEAASAPSRRRVLQVDYSSDNLPAGLEWLGI